MKKQALGISVLAAALTLSTGITAFAGQWQQDSKGWYYVQDNGSWVYGQAFTDPADGAQYFMDPDGYMMTETRVNGFWYGADGRRRDKTEAELAAEEARRQRIASRPSPAKAQAAADQAAQVAKTSNVAVSTTRLAYQAEMKALMDIIFIDTRTKVPNTAIKGDTTEDNLEVSYRFNADGKGTILSCSLWKMSNPENSNYKSEALELSYNRNILSDAEEVATFNDAFRRLLVASLGENRGNAVYERCLAQEVGGSDRFEETNPSDTGNPFDLTYRNSAVTIKVTCSEIDPNAAAEEEQQAEASTDETAKEETPQQPTTSVIVAGQGADNASDGQTEAGEGTTTDSEATSGEGETSDSEADAGTGETSGSESDAGEDSGAGEAA